MKPRNLFIMCTIIFASFACEVEEHMNTDQSPTKIDKVTDTVTNCYSIEIQNSLVNWKGSMVGIYSHSGTVKLSEGSLCIKNNIITKGDFIIDLNHIYISESDALYKTASSIYLIAHLMSDDFFSTSNYPTASLAVKKHEGQFITGDLTIKGFTFEETISNVKITESNGILTAIGDLIFDRQKYGITYKTKIADLVISEEIELGISITAISNQTN